MWITIICRYTALWEQVGCSFVSLTFENLQCSFCIMLNSNTIFCSRYSLYWNLVLHDNWCVALNQINLSLLHMTSTKRFDEIMSRVWSFVFWNYEIIMNFLDVKLTNITLLSTRIRDIYLRLKFYLMLVLSGVSFFTDLELSSITYNLYKDKRSSVLIWHLSDRYFHFLRLPSPSLHRQQLLLF